MNQKESLMNCPDCGYELSDLDVSCPRCDLSAVYEKTVPSQIRPIAPLSIAVPHLHFPHAPNPQPAARKRSPLMWGLLGFGWCIVILLLAASAILAVRQSKNSDEALIKAAIAGLTNGQDDNSTLSQYYRTYWSTVVSRQDNQHAKVDFSNHEIFGHMAVRIVHQPTGDWKATTMKEGTEDRWRPLKNNVSPVHN